MRRHLFKVSVKAAMLSGDANNGLSLEAIEQVNPGKTALASALGPGFD